jgi:hypothetical protein
MKRLLIATLSGVLFGFVCLGFACSGKEDFNSWLAISIILSRTLIGFTIGISRFPMKYWAIHGIVMGFIVSLPFAFTAGMAPESETGMSGQMIFISSLVMGIFYGFLIELITTVLFKAKIPIGKS